jgi:hypothetical protein
MRAVGMALWRALPAALLTLVRALPAALLMTMLAPPMAAGALLTLWWLHPATGAELAGMPAGSGPGLLLAAVLAAYLLGGLPSFAAGLLHRWAQDWARPWGVALLMALVGTTVYFLSFGAHLLRDASAAEVQRTLLNHGLPAALGLMGASLLVSRVEKRE